MSYFIITIKKKKLAMKNLQNSTIKCLKSNLDFYYMKSFSSFTVKWISKYGQKITLILHNLYRKEHIYLLFRALELL